jgi:hypothetical protein
MDQLSTLKLFFWNAKILLETSNRSYSGHRIPTDEKMNYFVHKCQQDRSKLYKVTIQIPIYTEDYEDTVKPTLKECLREALKFASEDII